MGEVAWTQVALAWLKNVHEYIDESSPAAADKVAREIWEHAEILATFPEMGYRLHKKERHVRVLLYGHYRIAYLVKENRDVDILGVFHGSMNDIECYLP